MPGLTSILIVNFDGREHLARCLDTLRQQGLLASDPGGTDPGGRSEVIVVDNASRDGSAAMVRERFPEVRLEALERNVGFGAANNRAAALARGDALLLLNSDAWPAEGAVGRLRAALDADPGVGLVAPALRYPDGRRQFGWAPETGVLGEALQMARNPFEGRAFNHRLVPPLLRLFTGPGWYSGACLLVRASAFAKVGGFDEEIFLYFEDVDLCRRLRQAGWRLRDEPKAIVCHVKGGSGDEPAPQSVGYRRAQLYYYAKHRPAWERALLRAKLRWKFARVGDRARRAELLGLLEKGKEEERSPSARG